jgi:diguanylate cyclase (GGDEF)-like protein/PAS domain S-box-containing protein
MNDFSQEPAADPHLLQALAVNASDGLLAVDGEGIIRYANPAAEKLFFAPPGGLHGRLFGHPIVAGEPREIDVMHSNKRRASAEMRAVPLEGDGRAGHLVFLRQQEDRRRLRETLRRNAERLSTLISASPLAIVAVDGNGRVTQWNAAASRLFGWSEHEVVGQKLPLAAELDVFVQHALEGVFVTCAESGTVKNRDGHPLDLQVWTAPLGGERPLENGALFLAADVSGQHRAEAQAKRLAGLDLLTALPNRSHFIERLQLTLERYRHGDRRDFAVLHLGLDRFKHVNQSLGPHQGDELLRAVARRLASQVYDTDVVARTGGDEFTLLLRGVRHARDIARIADKLHACLQASFRLDGQELFVTASIGIALYPGDGDSAEMLLKNAGAAMERAKELGGNTSRFYTEDINRRARDQLALENALRLALEREELRLHYQPQVDTVSGGIVGVEALARWPRADGDAIPPTRFIPVAEATGLILALGEWALRTACRQARAWQEAGLPPIRVSVNVSARQFHDGRLPQTVAAALAESGLAPDRLELEITESILMKDAEGASATLFALKAMGVRLALDDFGTGYSGLSYLARLPLDTLKVDRAFVSGIVEQKSHQAIAQAILALAGGLHLRTVAEGVETPEQLKLLRSLRCDEIQGYLASPALPAEECAVLLAAGASLLPTPPAVWKPRRKTERVERKN